MEHTRMRTKRVRSTLENTAEEKDGVDFANAGR